MKNSVALLLALSSFIHFCVAPPVTQDKNKDKENEEINGLEDYMEYHRYLKEVVNALESDSDFRSKLEKAEEDDIKSGKIAEQLKFVAHHVRTRLDEIKRVELQRLKELTEKKNKLEHQFDKQDSHGHLDHENPHSFEIEDLKKLIAKTTRDLAEADKKRRNEFKEYELQKEYEKQKTLNETDEEHRKKLEDEFTQKEQKHKQHEKLHEPGHKAQLEEVWEEQDQMQQEFDPKMFFMLHDLDGNGMWDQDEVKALFIKELDKMYQSGAPEDDMRERAEEMERMRESVFTEIDTNRNGFIEYEEFLAQTRKSDFQQDHGWQGLDEQRPYTDEELAEYIRQHEIDRARHGYPPNAVHYPNQPPMHPGQVPPQQFHPGQVPQHPGVPLNVPHPDLNTNEVYHQPVQYPPPNQQYHPNQQYQQNMQPQQQFQHPNQQFQQPNPQYQQPNPQFQQPNPQLQQPNPQLQQPNPQLHQPNSQFQQPNQQFQQQNQLHQQQQQLPQANQHNQPPNPQYQQQNQPNQQNQQYQPNQNKPVQPPNTQQQGQANQPEHQQNIPIEQAAQKPQQPASSNKQPDPQVNMV